MRTILYIIKKEFIQVRRDPKLFAIVFMAPILQLLLMGYAATMDVNNVKTAVFDQDRSVTSRQFIRALECSGYFTAEKYVSGYPEIEELINKNRVIAAVVIPKDFEKKISRNETCKIQAIMDASDGNKASISFGYISLVTSSFSKNIIAARLDKSGIKLPAAGSYAPEVRVWYNPELKTRNFMVPAILGLILMIITTILMAMAIVKEREIGTLEQLIVTPIKPYQLIIGKIIPFVILGFADVLLVTAVMVFWFAIPVRGDFAFLMFASFLFVLSTLGLGLFLSTISKTQQQAMMVAMFGAMLPMIYLSGFAFPIENMPKLIQAVTYAIPLRYYITILRGVILKGTGPAELWQEALALFLMGAAILAISSMRFKKRLE